jgi:hypothetical protein
MKTVWKYELQPGLNEINFPEHAHMLSLGYREPTMTFILHVLVRTEKLSLPWHPETRKILLTNTGGEIPDEIAGKVDERKLRFIGTNKNWHAFEVLGNGERV